MRISDWSSDVCSSDLVPIANPLNREPIWVGILEGDTGSCRPNCPAPVMSFISPSNGARERMNVTWMSKHGFKARPQPTAFPRSEEHTSELQSLMRISYAVFCLKKKKHRKHQLIIRLKM